MAKLRIAKKKPANVAQARLIDRIHGKYPVHPITSCADDLSKIVGYEVTRGALNNLIDRTPGTPGTRKTRVWFALLETLRLTEEELYTPEPEPVILQVAPPPKPSTDWMRVAEQVARVGAIADEQVAKEWLENAKKWHAALRSLRDLE